jgi:hypothetical protein
MLQSIAMTIQPECWTAEEDRVLWAQRSICDNASWISSGTATSRDHDV